MMRVVFLLLVVGLCVGGIVAVAISLSGCRGSSAVTIGGAVQVTGCQSPATPERLR
jgi:hypothetical protein